METAVSPAASKKKKKVSKPKETYIIWSAREIAKTWDNLMEAQDVAEEAANKHKQDMYILKLVETVEPVR